LANVAKKEGRDVDCKKSRHKKGNGERVFSIFVRKIEGWERVGLGEAR